MGSGTHVGAGGENHGRHVRGLRGEVHAVAVVAAGDGEVGLERGHVQLHGHGVAGGVRCCGERGGGDESSEAFSGFDLSLFFLSCVIRRREEPELAVRAEEFVNGRGRRAFGPVGVRVGSICLCAGATRIGPCSLAN